MKYQAIPDSNKKLHIFRKEEQIKNFGRTLNIIVLPKFSFLFSFVVATAMLCFHRLHGAFRADAFAL